MDTPCSLRPAARARFGSFREDDGVSEAPLRYVFVLTPPEGDAACWNLAFVSFAGSQLPSPDVLMVRAGLLVSVEVLEAAEQITERWQPTEVWGMSPFGGSTTEPIWEKFDPRIFMRNPQSCTPAQAAFRTAFHLPAIDKIALGTSNPQHLCELAESVNHDVDQGTIDQYRRLLRNGRQED